MLQRLGSSDSGLSGAEAADRLEHYGPNVVGLHRVRAVAVLWGQLRNPLLLLLLVAAAVSGLTGDSTDTIIIAVIVALSVGLGFVNEYRAAVAVEQLHERIRRQPVVWRDGHQRSLDVTQLVPGNRPAPWAPVIAGAYATKALTALPSASERMLSGRDIR